MMRGGVVGLFPDIQAGRYGGVEESGRLAWHAVAQVTRGRDEPATLFCYGANVAAQGGGEYIGARSKGEAVWRILRAGAQPRVLLVWHLGLLKLVPFLRAGNARLVVFLHGIEAWREQDAFTRRVLRRVNLFLTNSAYTFERFIRFVPEAGKVAHRVVPLGIGAPDTTGRVPDTPPTALMVSRLDRDEDYKGHREVIAAWCAVRAQVPGAQLWIAGDGSLRPALEAAAQSSGVADAVQFRGRVSETEKNELLRACRCFAMPSRGEGFGLVYLEAMRVGRPCLVGDGDGGREVVSPPEAGLAVNPGAVTQVTAALVRLLSDGDEWRAWSQNARARYEREFTAAQFQARMVSALAGQW